MIITNKMNLPQPIVDAIKNDDYDRGDARRSVTQLIDPAQKVALTEAHEDELEEDASNMIYALQGKSVHTILERAGSLMPTERRLFAECLGWKISGALDRMALMKEALGVKIQDYKNTSVWSLVMEPRGYKTDWVKQLNLYAWLLRQNGYNPQALEIVCFLRDWSKLEAKRRPRDYPQHQVKTLEIPLWPTADTEAYIKSRVQAHQDAQAAMETGAPLEACTDKDRWVRPTKWAVMKQGRKSAVRVFDNHADAKSLLETKDAQHSIEVRPGEAIRCANYCAAAPFCRQYQAELPEAAE